MLFFPINVWKFSYQHNSAGEREVTNSCDGVAEQWKACKWSKFNFKLIRVCHEISFDLSDKFIIDFEKCLI